VMCPCQACDDGMPKTKFDKRTNNIGVAIIFLILLISNPILAISLGLILIILIAMFGKKWL